MNIQYPRIFKILSKDIMERHGLPVTEIYFKDTVKQCNMEQWWKIQQWNKIVGLETHTCKYGPSISWSDIVVLQSSVNKIIF